MLNEVECKNHVERTVEERRPSGIGLDERCQLPRATEVQRLRRHIKSNDTCEAEVAKVRNIKPGSAPDVEDAWSG